MKRLVILAPNWLGDAVMALPAIADVRRGAPDAHLAVAARPSIAPLFALVDGVDETVTLPPRARADATSWRRAGAALAGGRFDAALLLPNSIHAALTARSAAVPERWGYRRSGRGVLLTRAIAPPSGLHQVEYYQQLVHALGFTNGSIEPRVTVAADVRMRGADALHAAGWNRAAPLAALAPGAAYGGAKRWPPASFAELAGALAADGIQSVMIGTRADAPSAAEVASAYRGTLPLLSLVGATDLPTLAGVLASCRAIVTNDSGAMHLAAAVGVPVTAVFGPTDDQATRPMGDSHAVVTHDVWCRPCMLRECPLDHRCMRGVAAADVLARIAWP